MYPAEIKDTTENVDSASYLIYYYRLGGMVNFTLPFTTIEMISISTSQTFRSWVVVFYLHRPMVFYLSSYTIRPGLLLVWLFYYEGQATFQ